MIKMKPKKLKVEKEGNIKTAKFTKFVRNLKCFFIKKKKIITKRREGNDLNESDFFKTMKDMMILGLRKEDVIKYFKKDKFLRAEIETRTVADYLSLDKKNIFFNNIRKISKGKLYTLVRNLTLEFHKKDDLIFLYKEPMNKFCIILEGTISLFLPYFTKKLITIKEFLNYFFYTKKNFPKSFVRVEKKNENLFDGIHQLKINEYDMKCLSDIDEKKKQEFYIEEYQNVYNLYAGNQVNQISILYNLVQNFNGYAKTDVYLLSLNKSDFISNLRTFLEDELSKEFGKLRKCCYIFNLWSNYSLAQIMNYYIPLEFINEENVYNQNNESDSFYIIQDGIFEAYCEISMAEFSKYKRYIFKNHQNIIEWIKEEKEKKNKISIEKIIDYLNSKDHNENYLEGNEIIEKNIIYIKKKLLNTEEENDQKLINLKVNEDILKDKNKKIKIKLFTLHKNDFFGLEDSLELKKRFYSVHCISDRGIINKIRILDFIVFLACNHALNLQNIINYAKERKNKIIERIQNYLNKELNNIKRTISNAYSITLTSYENRKRLNLKIKKDNIYKINYINNLTKNEKLIKKINEFNQQKETINAYQENKNFRRRKSCKKRTVILNQLINKENHRNSLGNKEWNFTEENENKIEKNNKRAQTSRTKYIVTSSSSNTDRKSKSHKNKIFIYDKNINNIYFSKDYTFSKSSKNYKNQFKDFNLAYTTLYNKEYDLIKNKDLSYYNRKLDKEIINMTGIYNTKREISKKIIFIHSPSKKEKNMKDLINNYKLSHSKNFINHKDKENQNSSLLAILKDKKFKYESIKGKIPHMKNIKLRTFINN